MNGFATEMMKHEILGNTLTDLATALVVLVLGLVAVRAVKQVLARRILRSAEPTPFTTAAFLSGNLDTIGFPLAYLSVLYVALTSLRLGSRGDRLIGGLASVAITYFAVRFLSGAVRHGLGEYWVRREPDPVRQGSVRALLPVLNCAIWVLGVAFLLDNLGFDVSTVVAGLGIGGIAVALAGQAVLGDLFSYFAILFDRPFDLGDFVIVGEFMGTVEHVGIKTTRLRSLHGEQLVFSNTDLTGSRLKNYKRMESRRVAFRFGVTYDATSSELAIVPEVVRDIIEETAGTRFERAHFAAFGASSLDFEVVYHVLSPDYAVYMDLQHSINLALKEGIEAIGLAFAFPTQTLHLVSSQRPAAPPRQDFALAPQAGDSAFHAHVAGRTPAEERSDERAQLAARCTAGEETAL